MAESTKQKQTFLRQQIIEAGYDAGQFVEYLANQRENGDDVDVWSIRSLEDMVAKFRDDHSVRDSLPMSPPDTPGRQSGSMAQMSAMAQSKASQSKASQSKASQSKDESDDDNEDVNTPEKILPDRDDANGSSAKHEDQMEEELIRRSKIDQSDVLQANKISGFSGALSETERIKKQLYEKALMDKKSTIVDRYD